MLFPSFTFLVFAAFFFAIWSFANKQRNIRYLFLVIASFIFYGWWDWRYLFLLLGSGIIDYIAGLGIYHQAKRRRFWLALSIAANIGSLAIFKYSLFFATNIEHLLLIFGINIEIVRYVPHFALTVPVGISFYTFQSMSYTFDIFNNKLKPTRNPLHFFAYLSLFPQLVAGPIVRAKDLLYELAEKPQMSSETRWTGTTLIASGFFMKVVLADNLSVFINQAFAIGFDEPGGWFYWWCVAIAFSLQIYCDFAGYSRIARGLALWMGYSFPLNFDHPYRALSIQDFWRRWHISLTTWFRDYVYIPLGGSKKGEWRTYANIWIVWLLSGLWHGAGWTFVIWGGLHALYLSIERLTQWTTRVRQLGNWTYPFIYSIITVQVVVAWMFFRAASITEAWRVIQAMFAFGKPSDIDEIINYYPLAFWIVVAILFEITLSVFDSATIPAVSQSNRRLVYISTLFLFLSAIFLRGPVTEFVYFQF